MKAEGGIVPRFLLGCMKEIENRGLTVDGIYRYPVDDAHVQKLQDRTDQGIQIYVCTKESTKFINPKARGCSAQVQQGATKGLRVYNFVDSFVYAYKCFRLYLLTLLL